MLTYLDDHSRFIPSSRTQTQRTPSGSSTNASTSTAGRSKSPPTEEPNSIPREQAGNGIKHIVTSVRRPSTLGKVEAFHKAYVYEAWIYPTRQGFVTYWNYEHPHQGIGWLYPADLYFNDLRDRSWRIEQVLRVACLDH